MWHFAQSVRLWAPVSGNRVALWSKFAGRQARVSWQLWHWSGKAEALWLGFVVRS
jgi:hypothetical protein